MFDATKESILGVLLEVMEGSFERQNTLVCLNGFQYAIRISCHSDMPAARDTFVDALEKLTLFASMEDMNFKHVDAIRTLMHIAVSDGEYLGESWGPVLRCISRLATMRMKAESIKDADFPALAKKRRSFARRFFRNQQKKPDPNLTKDKEALMKLGILESVGDQLIDTVFSSTVDLSARALESFTEQLIATSMAELAEGDGGQVQLMMGMTNTYSEDQIALDTTSSDDELSDDSTSIESTAEGTNGKDETEDKHEDTDGNDGADTDDNDASSS
jgi:brefeldin A-inhibited guanine nucleotide-exchange protein